MSEEKGASRQPNWGVGVAIGMGIGVALSVALDNWAFLAIGAGLMVAFAYAMPIRRQGGDEGDATDPADPPPSDDR